MHRTLITAAFAAAALAAPAFAATSTFKMDVAYTKANLATPAGAAKEYDHIRKQIVERCKAEQSDVRFATDFAVNACTERTLSNAVRTIGDANLKRVHAGR